MISATRWHCTPPYWKFSAPQKSCHGKSSSCRATLCDFSSWRVAFRKLERTLLTSQTFFLFDMWLLMLLFLLSITNPIWHLLYLKVFKTPECGKTSRIQSVRLAVFFWHWLYYIYIIDYNIIYAKWCCMKIPCLNCCWLFPYSLYHSMGPQENLSTCKLMLHMWHFGQFKCAKKKTCENMNFTCGFHF